MKLKDIIISESTSSGDDRLSHLGDLGKYSPHRGDPTVDINLPGPGGGSGSGRNITGVSGSLRPKSNTTTPNKSKETFKDLNPKDVKPTDSKSVLSKIRDLVSKPKEAPPVKVEPTIGDTKPISASTKQVKSTTPNSATTTQSISGKVQKPKIELKPGETPKDAIKRVQNKPLSKEAEKYKQDQEKWKDWADKNKETKTEKPKDSAPIKTDKKKIEPTLGEPSKTSAASKKQARVEPSMTAAKKPSTQTSTKSGKKYDGEEGELGVTPKEKAVMKAGGLGVAATLGMAGMGYKDALKGDEEDTTTKDADNKDDSSTQEKPDTPKPADSTTDDNKSDTPSSEKPTNDTDSTPDADAAGRATRSTTNVPSSKPVTSTSDELATIKRLSNIPSTSNKASDKFVTTKKSDYKVKPLTLPSDSDFEVPKKATIEPRKPDYTVEPDPEAANVPAEPKPSRPGEYDKSDRGLLGGEIKYRTDDQGRHWIANPHKQQPAMMNFARGEPDEVPYITSGQVSDVVDRAKSGVKNILGMNESVKANEALSLIKRLSKQ